MFFFLLTLQLIDARRIITCSNSTQTHFPKCSTEITAPIGGSITVYSPTDSDFINFKLPRFVKNNTGEEVLCSLTWGRSVFPTCLTIDNIPCQGDCFWNTSYYYCNTTSGLGICNMNVCNDTQADHDNYPQSNPCMELCRTQPCDGGSNYCNTTFLSTYYNTTGASCDTQSICFCRRGTYKTTKRLTKMITSTPVDSIQSFSVQSELTSDANHYCSSNMEGSTMSLTCDVLGFYIISKGVNSVIGNMTSLTTPVTFTPSFMVLSEELHVYIYFDGLQIYSNSYMFTGRSVCEMVDCTWCTDNWNNMHCYPWQYRMMVGAMILFMLAIIIAMIYLVFGPCLGLIAVFWLAFCWIFKCMGYTYKKVRKPLTSAYEAVNQDEETSSIRRRGITTSSSLTDHSLLISVITCCLIQPVLSDFISIPSACFNAMYNPINLNFIEYSYLTSYGDICTNGSLTAFEFAKFDNLYDPTFTRFVLTESNIKDIQFVRNVDFTRPNIALFHYNQVKNKPLEMPLIHYYTNYTYMFDKEVEKDNHITKYVDPFSYPGMELEILTYAPLYVILSMFMISLVSTAYENNAVDDYLKFILSNVNIFRVSINTMLMKNQQFILKSIKHTYLSLILIGLIFLYYPYVYSCTEVPTVISDVETCTYSQNTASCNISYNIQYTLPSINSKACYTFKTTNNEVLGQLNVTYLAHRFTATPEFLYWTSSWVGKTEVDKTCYTPSNWCGNRCNNMAANDRTGQGNLDNTDVTTCPGYTRCERTCGCAGCGCFYCDAACTVARYAAKPIGSVYGAYHIIGYQNNFDVLLEYSTFDGVLFHPVVSSVRRLSYNIEDITNTLSMTFTGSFVPPQTTVLTDKAFLTNNTVPVLIGAYAQRNSPHYGLIGDLQGDSPSQFVCGTTTGALNLKLATDVAIINSISSVSFHQPGITTAVTLPSTIGGLVWSSTGTTIYTNLTSVSPLLLNLKSTTPLQVVRLVTTVCPDIVILNTTGCYNCDPGFRVYFNLKSTCLTGAVIITSPNCVDNSFLVTNDYKTYYVSCSSTTQNIDITLTAISGENEDTDMIHAILDFMPVLSNDTLDTSAPGIRQKSIGFSADFLTSGILGIPAGLGSLWNFLINVFMLIIIIILAYIIIKYGLPIVSQMLKKDKQT